MLSVVVDLGGTNIRFAVCDLKTGALEKLKEIPCAEFLNIEDAILSYFSTLDDTVGHLCIGIACPVEQDRVVMTNLNWEFSKKALKKKLQLSTLHVINDYTAISLAVPFLPESDQIKIGGGSAQPDGVKGVFGPGTGLGVAHIIKAAGKWISLEGEGGHVSFAPNTREQAEILLLLQERFGHVSAERILSGQGLVNIYQSLCSLSGKPAMLIQPSEVSKAAINGTCDIARRSLDVFCEVMGSFAGNLALNLSCRGGIYIAGGIVPRFVDFLKDSDFRAYFESKGRFNDYLAQIPVFLITNSNPGLLGASVYLSQELCA
jgi:glucokinase